MSEQTVAEQPKAKTLVTKLCEAGANACRCTKKRQVGGLLAEAREKESK